MIVLVNRHVLDPYNRMNFTLQLKILCFVHKDMYRDPQTGPNMEKATCAFLHLASTSSSVPPVVETILPRYVKTVTCSKAFPLRMISPVFGGARILISLVLDAFSPTLSARPWSASNFCRACVTQQNSVVCKPQVFKLVEHA